MQTTAGHQAIALHALSTMQLLVESTEAVHHCSLGADYGLEHAECQLQLLQIFAAVVPGMDVHPFTDFCYQQEFHKQPAWWQRIMRRSMHMPFKGSSRESCELITQE